MKKKDMLLVAGYLALLFAGSACFAQMYTVTDLGTLGGSISVAYGINTSGQVVGWSYTGASDPLAGPIIHAFRTAPNSPINPATDDLGTLGGFYSWAYGINDSGHVVGNSYTGTDEPGFCCIQHAFRTAPNSPINPANDDLGTLGGSFSIAYGINASGQVVGTSDNGIDTCATPHGPNPAQHAFRTAPNMPINPNTDDLGTLGGCSSVALGVNGSGQVVGDASSNAGLHAFRTAANSAINPATDDLGTLGGIGIVANAINDLGQVVGFDDIAGPCCYARAFRTAPNSPINPATDDLGAIAQAIWPAQPSPATGINSFGQVVGGSPAFVYGSGAMHDLNTLIPADSGWELIMAYGINDAGQIVGMGARGGNSGYGVGRAYLLTPIYQAFVQPPIKADGTSVFKAARGVVPAKFTLTKYGVPTCALLPATIALTRTTGELVDESAYLTNANDGPNFRIDPAACQYVYNLAASALGAGAYRVDISINGVFIGHAVFALK